jgi:hemoglobin
MARPTIYEYAGGTPAFLALATDFHARCLADPVLNHPFSHADQNPGHVPRLAAYWGAVFGGPPAPSDHSAILRMHAHQGMDDDLGERFFTCFVAAVGSAKITDDPELRAVLLSYMRWAVDEVMSYNPNDTVVPAAAPFPQWDWTGRHA